MRPGIKAKRPRQNRYERRSSKRWDLAAAIMALFPATSWKNEIPMFNPNPSNTGLIWANTGTAPGPTLADLLAEGRAKGIVDTVKIPVTIGLIGCPNTRDPFEYQRFRSLGLQILKDPLYDR